jgi:hypothetical protein
MVVRNDDAYLHYVHTSLYIHCTVPERRAVGDDSSPPVTVGLELEFTTSEFYKVHTTMIYERVIVVGINVVKWHIP